MAKEVIKRGARDRRVALVRDVIKRFPDAPARTLGRKLLAEHPELFSSVEAARNLVRYVLGVKGKDSRNQAAEKDLFRKKRKAGAIPKMPESKSKPWEPFVVEDCNRVLVLSDIHVPFHDVAALNCAIAFGVKYKPDTIIINGDLLDFQGISRFARDPRGPTVKQELDICAEFIRHLRGTFPKARIIFKLGNHDERWEKMLWLQAPALLDCVEFAWHELAGFKECNIEVVGEQRIVMVGKLAVLHGHELPKGLTNSVNPARGAFLRCLDPVLVGHYHQAGTQSVKTLHGRRIMCWSTGCLCDLTPEYMRVNRHEHGFATVDVSSNGNYTVTPRNIMDGEIH